MKKAVVPLVVISVAAIAAAFLVLNKHSVGRIQAADLVPSGALFMAELPDIQRTAQRWQGTALNQVWQTPEVQAFLEKPVAGAPIPAEAKTTLDRIVHTAPKSGFFALTSIDGGPQFIAGFSYGGNRSDVEALLAEPRKSIRAKMPAGKAEIVTYGKSEIQTFGDPAHKDEVIAEAFRDNWYFVSNRVELLHATLDRYEGHPPTGASALSADLSYQQTIAPIPSDSDAVVYGTLGGLADRFIALMETAGQKADPTQVAEIRNIVGVAASTKIEGKNFRDTFFLNMKATPAQEKLARNGLPLTSEDTLVFYSGVLPTKFELPAASQVLLNQYLTQFAPALESSMAANGLAVSDLSTLVGPEYSVVIDWPKTAMQPSLLAALDVRDAVKTRSFIQALAQTGKAGGWQQSDENGVTFYSAPTAPGTVSLISPCVAVSEKFVFAGLSRETVTAGLTRLGKKGGGLAQLPSFQAMEKEVGAPTGAFAYIDGKLAVERSYGALRPLLAMSLAFNPATSQYIDAGKLPTPEALAKPLGPTIYSQFTRKDGVLAESVGPLTINQGAVVVLAGVGISAFSTIQQAIQGGLPGFSGLPSLTAPPVGAVTPVAPAGSATDVEAQDAPKDQ